MFFGKFGTTIVFAPWPNSWRVGNSTQKAILEGVSANCKTSDVFTGVLEYTVCVCSRKIHEIYYIHFSAALLVAS